MDTKLKGYWEKVKEFFQKLSKKMKIALAAGAVVLLVLLIALVYMLTRPEEYSVLFTDLESAEASQIIAYLENAGISSRMEGSTIYVPASQEAALKARLVMEGYPQSGYAYESYWNNISIGTTNQQDRRAFILALQERLQAVISKMDGVRGASVQLEEGEDRRYVLDDSNLTEATASVMVEMKPGQQLSQKQADAIRHLVSRSVKGLDIDNVAIIDEKGNTFSADASGLGELSDGTQLKIKFEEWSANRIRNEVMQVLEGPFGSGNVRVGVTVTGDVSVRVKETTSFTYPDKIGEDGRGVIGQEYWLDEIIRDGELAVGGVPGTSTNADLNDFSDYVDGLLQDPGENNAVINYGDKNYENPTTTEQERGVAGVITDVSLAVSVNHENDGSISPEEIQAHVAAAAGIPDQPEKVHVWITPFYNYVEPVDVSDNPFSTVPTWALYAAVAGLILFIVLLAVILSISKKRQKEREREMLAALGEAEAAALAEAAAMAAAGGNPMAPPQTGADIMDINAEKSMELRKTVRQFVNNNPEIAAQMLKTWLRAGKEEGNA